jgi:AraC-like DNA-binding protein
MYSDTGSGGGEVSDDSEFDEIALRLTAEERAYQAYNLRVAGHDWATIAQRIGYDSPSSANRDVSHLISKARGYISDERKMEIAEMELARLDALQAAYWDAALQMDHKSADLVLKFMIHRARLSQLFEEHTTSSRTIIVTSEDYVERLKEIAEE